MKGIAPAQIGYAADDRGIGIAYVRMGAAASERVLRVPFAVKRYSGLCGREIGYAALTAVAAELRKRQVDCLRLTVDDRALVGDLREHREVPAALTMAYVRLRCALNQFARFEFADAPERESDLTARARSEVALHVAA